MERIYHNVLADHLQKYDQMAFLSGPRQVGKTTLAKEFLKTTEKNLYLNWDSIKHRKIMLSGYESVVDPLLLDTLSADKPLILFDEIHKYKSWKNYLKGFIDDYKGQIQVLVTGSAKLNVFRRGGDSLMGRYFLYRIHPLSVRELNHLDFNNKLFTTPSHFDEEKFDALFRFGGYPEPFLKQDEIFYKRWQNLRLEQLFREDIRSLSQVQDISQMELLAYKLRHQTAQLLNYSNLANKIRVSEPTIRRWLKLMESFFYIFTLKPWSQNVARSLLKEPKVYLWDWSLVEDLGARIENFVASHLLKAVHFWTDLGYGQFELYFLRDKDQKEVDFLITKDEKPWMMIEVKKSPQEPLSKSLRHFAEQLQPKHVFQVAFDMPFLDYNCEELTEPKIVPARTLLAQLI